MAKKQDMQHNDDMLDNDDDVQTIPIKPRINLLKERATRLGIPYSPNIGADTLAERIENFLAGNADKDMRDDYEDEAGLPQVTSLVELRKAAQKLVRVNVFPNDPMRQQMLGEYVWSGNSSIATFAKFIPFSTPRGYHVPQILLDVLRDRTYTGFMIKKDAYNNDIPYPVQRKAYTIEVLPPLTEKQLQKIADRQAAARKWEEEANFDDDEV